MTDPLDASSRLHPAVAHHVASSLGWAALRPLQSAAIGPVLDGDHALLVAPTAGGKTEAAMLPLLSAMTERRWRGTSVLYLAPLRALLNNLEPRLTAMTGWLGRRVVVWHGDVPASQKRRAAADPPDVLLTTPESLEGMLISAHVDTSWLFGGLRTVVVDEVHAFASGDRGWHLLGVLSRLSRLTGRPVQRVGLSATVGNPEQLLEWLAGGTPGRRTVVVPPPGAAGSAVPVEVTLDHVGTLDNAATVIAALHAGEKRLVFADSRAKVESLAAALRRRDVTTYVSHSSLAADERRQAERAFAEASDCVIVATSTLELGIDVGDLDRVVQVDAPPTVASFLQRLGRTGRRPGTVRNTLLLATGEHALWRAAALLTLWGRGYVEPVEPPVLPRHIVAQQLMGLALQERQVVRNDVWPWLGPLASVPDADRVLEGLVAEGWLTDDGGVLWIGPTAERAYGRRYFRDLTSAFTVERMLAVLHGRTEVGTLSPLALASREDGPRVLLLGGRSWLVRQVDWRSGRVLVEPTDLHGRSRWGGGGGGMAYALAQAHRDVLLGDPPVTLTRRAVTALAGVRQEHGHLARSSRDGTPASVLVRAGDELSWWTFGGHAANAALSDGLSGLVDPTVRAPDALRVPLDPAVSYDDLRTALRQRREALVATVPAVDDAVVDELKFSASVPRELARDTVARRLVDPVAVAAVVDAPVAG